MASPTEKGVGPLDVTAYGAVGNGTNDDTTAIRACVLEAAQGRGDVVYFPGGHYRISSTIDIPAINTAYHRGVMLQGEGWIFTENGGAAANNPNQGTVQISPTSGFVGPMFDMTGGLGSGNTQPSMQGGIRDIAFENLSGGDSTAVRTNACLSGQFENVKFQSFGANAFVFDGEVFYAFFRNVNMISSQIVFRDRLNHPAFYGCNFTKYSGTGGAFRAEGTVKGWTGTGIPFYSCLFERNNQNAIYINNAFTVDFHSCYFEANNDAPTTDGAAIEFNALAGGAGTLPSAVNFYSSHWRTEQSTREALLKVNGSARINMISTNCAPDASGINAFVWLTGSSGSTKAHFLQCDINSTAGSPSEVAFFKAAGNAPPSGANLITTQCAAFPATG